MSGAEYYDTDIIERIEFKSSEQVVSTYPMLKGVMKIIFKDELSEMKL